MLIYCFVNRYPSEYKPYYDAQFSTLVQAGHELRIFALGASYGGLTDRVIKYGLRDRTKYVLADDIRGMPFRIAPVLMNLVRNPVRRLRMAVQVTRGSRDRLRHRVKAALRAWALPVVPPDVVIVHGHRTMTAFRWLPRVWPGVPVGLFYYGGDPTEAGVLDVELMRRVLRVPHVIVTLSRYAAQELARWDVRPETVAVLPLSFALGDFRPPEPRVYHQGGTTRLVLAGRLSEGKGQRYALQALAILKAEGLNTVHLFIAGDGPLRAEIERQIVELELQEQVDVLGALDNPDLIRLFGQVDALLLASHPIPTWTETQGTVIQEAMLMEAVAITTATGGVPESVPDALKPYQVPPADAHALAEAIRRVHELPATELAVLGRHCREWVIRNFDVVVFNERLLGLLTAAGTPGLGYTSDNVQ